MTGRYRDGFDWLQTGQSAAVNDQHLQAAGYYIRRDVPTTIAAGTPSAAVPGRLGFGNCLSVGGSVAVGSGGYRVVRPLDAEAGIVAATAFLGMGLFVPSTSLAAFPWIGFYDGVNDSPQVTVQLCPNGVLRAFRGYPNGGAPLGVSKVGAYPFDTWCQLELGATIHATAGYVEVRVNTVPRINLVAQNTKATAVAGIDAFGFGCQSQGGIDQPFQFLLDDIYVNDDQGAVNNTFLGAVRVKTQFPTGAGASTQFARVGAQPTNWQAASNLAIDDSSYVADGTSGHKDTYAMQAIMGPAAVHDVQTRIFWRQDDATQQIGHAVLKSGGTTIESRDHFTNETYFGSTDVIELDPDTGVGWTGAGVNAIEVGPKNAT